MSSDQASGSKFPDSGHGSGVKRTADTDSDSEQSQNKRGKKEKSPTLESLIILKRAVYLLLNVCGEIATSVNPDIDQLRRLYDVLTDGIEILEPLEQKIQERLKLIKKTVNELPTEENSPYTKDSIGKQPRTLNIDDAIFNFISSYNWSCMKATDIINSVGGRQVVKLLAIQRTYQGVMPLLKQRKQTIENRIQRLKQSHSGNANI